MSLWVQNRTKITILIFVKISKFERQRKKTPKPPGADALLTSAFRDLLRTITQSNEEVSSNFQNEVQAGALFFKMSLKNEKFYSNNLPNFIIIRPPVQTSTTRSDAYIALAQSNEEISSKFQNEVTGNVYVFQMIPKRHTFINKKFTTFERRRNHFAKSDAYGHLHLGTFSEP